MIDSGEIERATETIGLAVLAIAIVLGTFRLVRGPSLPDRVIALDLLALIGLAMMSFYAMRTGDSVYLDVGIVIALVSFLTTIAFAFYIEKSTTSARDTPARDRSGGPE